MEKLCFSKSKQPQDRKGRMVLGESIGIIGGADGPTVIYVTNNTNFDWLRGGILAGILVLVIVAIVVYRKKKK